MHAKAAVEKKQNNLLILFLLLSLTSKGSVAIIMEITLRLSSEKSLKVVLLIAWSPEEVRKDHNNIAVCRLVTRHRYFIRPKKKWKMLWHKFIYIRQLWMVSSIQSINFITFYHGSLRSVKKQSGIRKSHEILEGGKRTIIDSTNKLFRISSTTHNHPRQQENFLSISDRLMPTFSFYSCTLAGGCLFWWPSLGKDA